MGIEIGSIIEGKVTGIAKFGAFVSFGEGKSGLVHISEVSSGFVSDINEHLKVGDSVKVKVISVDDKGRINLSIRQAQPKPEGGSRPPAAPSRAPRSESAVSFVPPEPKGPASFEDMLQKFKQDSDSKLSDLKAKEDGGRNRKRSRK